MCMYVCLFNYDKNRYNRWNNNGVEQSQAIGTDKYVSCNTKAKATYGLVKYNERLEYYSTLTRGSTGYENVGNTRWTFIRKSQPKIWRLHKIAAMQLPQFSIDEWKSIQTYRKKLQFIHTYSFDVETFKRFHVC